MQRKVGLLWLVLALIVVVSTGSAYAQGGEGDKVVVGQTYVLPAGQTLDGDLTVIGGTATLEASSVVRGDVAVLGGTLTVAGTIEGDLTAFGGQISLADTAVVKGDLADLGGRVHRVPGAVIGGETFGMPGVPVPSLPPEVPNVPVPSDRLRVDGRPRGPLSAIGGLLRWQLATVGWGLLLAMLGVLAVLVAPKPIERIARTVESDPAVSFGVGLLTLAAAALAGGLLLIACGVGLLIWLAAMLALLLGWIAIGLWVGQRLLRALKTPSASSLVEAAVGVFIITLLWRIPWCIGFLFGGIVGSTGLGAVVLSRFGTQDAALTWGPSGANGPGSGQLGPAIDLDSHAVVAVPAKPRPDAELGLDEGPSDTSAGLGGVGPGEAGPEPQPPTDTEDDLAAISGIGPEFAARLREAGIRTFEALANSTPDELAVKIDVPAERIVRDDWIGQARQRA